MKNIILKKARLFGVLLLMLFLFIAAGCSMMQVRAEEVASVMEQELESEYFVGQAIKIPSAELIVDGANISAEARVICPDGTVVSSNQIVLKQAGKYTVRYEAKKDNTNYFNLKTFNVYKTVYEISGNGDAVYGPEQKFDAEGLKVSLTENSVFKLNKKVNLVDLEDETPFIKFRINPEREGFAELHNIFIKVSDANDPSVFFALKVGYLSTRLNAAECANVFGYINDLTTIYSGATVCVPQVAEWSGQPLKASFVGDTSIGEVKDQFISFYFNPIKQEVLGEDLTNNKYVVLSLSSFPDEWSGFTSDEVYLEIYGENFKATKANLFIESIGDIDLSVKEFLDVDAPTITVDCGDINPNDCPKGYIGASYPVFDATAVDYNEGVKSVVKNVYYNYYSDSKISVPIVDGRFTPTRAGVYTIVYTASDSFANISEQYIDVEIEDVETAPQFTCNALNEYTTNCKVGESVELPEVVVSGYTHSYIVTTELTKDGKNFYFDSANNKFTFIESGVYTIKYTAFDFVGRECEFVYTLTVSANDEPFFLDDPEDFITDKFIVGYQYKLPTIKAVFVNSDNTKVDVPAVLSTNDGTVENGYFTPTAVGKIGFTCSATYNGKTVTKLIERQAYSIKNENGIDYKSLFSTSDNVVPCYSDSNYAEYMVTGNGKIEFVNTILTENAFIKIQADKSYADVSEVIFRLSNPSNFDKKLEVTFKSFDGSVFVSINQQEFQSVVGGDFSGNNPFEIKYVESERKVYVNGISYSAGKAGIDADYAELEIEVVGKTATSVYGLIVEKVGNQSLSKKITIDNQKPVISCIGDFSGSYAIGTTFVTPVVLAKDIVCPELKSFKMTVFDPNGNPISLNGVEMNDIDVKQIELELTTYGSYVFQYQAIDQSNKKETVSFVINVLDTVAPTVKIEGSYTTSGGIGKAINLAKFVAEDNFDSNENLVMRVLIMDTNHNFKIIPGGKSFTPDKVGNYTVFCYVTDTFGNVGICSYNIVVK